MSNNFIVPSVNLPHVPIYVKPETIIKAFDDAFDGVVQVDSCDSKVCVNNKTGEEFNMFFIHFSPLLRDPLNKNLTDFIRITKADKMAVFYYGTRINHRTGDPFFFKTRAFKPKVSADKGSSTKVVKKGMMSVEDMASLEKPSRSSLKKAANTAQHTETAADECADSDGSDEEEEEQAVDEN